MRDLGSAMLGICVRLCAVLGLNKLIYIRLYQVVRWGLYQVLVLGHIRKLY